MAVFRTVKNRNYTVMSNYHLRDKKGQMVDVEYIIYELPVNFIKYPCLENPTSGNPILENPTLENPILENCTQINKE